MRTFKDVQTGELPDTLSLLLEGGDARIRIVSGCNEYGCRPNPDPALISFASCTASTISESGFAAADALRQRIVKEPSGFTCDREFSRIRQELASLCDLQDPGGLKILFAASGTDIHLIASRLIAPEHIIMVEAAETGRGVPLALSGHHFGTGSARGRCLAREDALAEDTIFSVSEVSIRNADGSSRDAREIDDDVSRLVSSRIKTGGRVLLVLVDISKTGIIAPSPSCALELNERYPGSVEVLVDACQFRLSSSTLKAYLDKGFMIALTGSKFLTGPAFSGALLIPETVRNLKTPDGLPLSSSRFERPEKIWPEGTGTGINFGLLLRWEAALAEFRAFRGIPEKAAAEFLHSFARAIRCRLTSDPHLEALTVPVIKRLGLTEGKSWDAIQTIFPFRLRKDGRRLEPQETLHIHDLLQKDLSNLSNHPAASLRCSLGQPVRCGETGNALRLCASARLVGEGIENPGMVIRRALSVLDKIDLLLNLP